MGGTPRITRDVLRPERSLLTLPLRKAAWGVSNSVGASMRELKRVNEPLDPTEARNSALLRALPDLIFVTLRDGTYVDYQAKDPSLLFVPPSVFLGKRVRDIMPPPIADTLMDATEQVFHSDDVIVVEYELALGEIRFFEARLVRDSCDRAVTIVRDVTDLKRAMQVNHDLAGRLIASQEAERHRIGRELHDEVCQSVALAKIAVDQLAREAADEFKVRLEKLSESVDTIARELHNVSHALYPSKLQTLGLVRAVQSLCDDWSHQTGVQITFTHRNLTQEFDQQVSLCLYRIVQEALHNIGRYSGAAQAEVHLMEDSEQVTLRIADPGVGFDPQDTRHRGLGLLSIRERVAFFGGQVAIHARPGAGTRIGVRLPLRYHDSHAA